MTIEGSTPPISPSGRRYKAVLFDMGGILVQYKDPTAYDRLMKKAKADKQVYQELLNFDNGTQSVDELRSLLDELIPGLPPGDVENTIIENHAFLDIHMHQLINKLRKAGLKVGIVTNNGFWSTAKRRSVILTDVSKFDLVLESCRLGIRKPNPNIFKIAAQRLGVEPHECIFVDDTEGHCKSAREVGMTAVHAAGCDTATAAREIEEILDLNNNTQLNPYIHKNINHSNGYSHNNNNYLPSKENNGWNNRVTYITGNGKLPGAQISTFVWESTYV